MRPTCPLTGTARRPGKWPANSRRPVVKRGFETCPLHSMCIQASGRFLRAQHVDTTRRQSPLFDASPLVPVYGTPWRCRGGGAHSSPSRGRGRNALECTTCAPALSLAAASAACSGKSMGAKTRDLSQGEGTLLNALRTHPPCHWQQHLRHAATKARVPRPEIKLHPQPPSCKPETCAEGCALAARQPGDRPRQRRAPPEQGKMYTAASHPAAAPARQTAPAAFGCRACSDRLLASPRLSPASHATRNAAGPSSAGSHCAQDARQRVPEPLAVRRRHRQLLHVVVHAHDEQLAAAAARAVRAARAAALGARLGDQHLPPSARAQPAPRLPRATRRRVRAGNGRRARACMRCARSQRAPAQAGRAPAAPSGARPLATANTHVALERGARRAPGTRAPTPGCAGAAPVRPRSPRPPPAARRTAPPPAARCPARPAAARAQAGHPRRPHRPRPNRRSPDRRPDERGRARARAAGGRQCGGEPLRRRRSGAVRATRSAAGTSASRQATCGRARVAPRPQHQVHVRRGAAPRQHRSFYFLFVFALKTDACPAAAVGTPRSLHLQALPCPAPAGRRRPRSAPRRPARAAAAATGPAPARAAGAAPAHFAPAPNGAPCAPAAAAPAAPAAPGVPAAAAARAPAETSLAARALRLS